MQRRHGWPSAEASFLVSASLLLTAALTVLAQPGYWQKPEVVAPALTIDLALGLPVLGYLFLVRGGKRGRWILAPLAVLGLSLARWWIPDAHQDPSRGLRPLFVTAEAVLTLCLVTRVGGIVHEYVRLRDLRRSRPDALREALGQVLGRRLGGALFTEVSALWYATRLFQPARAAGQAVGRFPGHRRNGYPAVLGAILLLVGVETSVAHLLLGLWSPKAAWLSTILGIYSGIWLLGDYHAARLNPTSVNDHELTLNVGLRWHTVLAWSDIVGIHDDDPADASLRMTMFGAPDFWLELARPVRVLGPFGIVREARAVGVAVDAPSELRALIAERTRPIS